MLVQAATLAEAVAVVARNATSAARSAISLATAMKPVQVDTAADTRLRRDTVVAEGVLMALVREGAKDRTVILAVATAICLATALKARSVTTVRLLQKPCQIHPDTNGTQAVKLVI